MKLMALQVNKAIKDHKIAMPPNKESFQKLCKALNLHCTETLAYEGLIYCRGKNMDSAPPEEFDMDRMIYFLNLKSKMVAPADNPRIALQNRAPNGVRNNQNYYSGHAGSSLPALNPRVARMNHVKRAMIRS